MTYPINANCLVISGNVFWVDPEQAVIAIEIITDPKKDFELREFHSDGNEPAFAVSYKGKWIPFRDYCFDTVRENRADGEESEVKYVD